jgi:D-alanyl-D-alanine carboxypeptidase/D-alanyl-D-alanine-endopeptidase (penicillin-binding protein 4)
VLSPRATTRSLAAVLASAALGLAGSVQPSTAALAVAPPTAASVVTAAPGEDLTSVIVSAMRARQSASALGTAFSGRLVDVQTGGALWQVQPTTGRIPASNMKLVTAVAAIRSIGPDATFVTPTLQDPRYRSTVYLRGVGDPTLTSSALSRLAGATASRLLAQGIGVVNVKVDDYLFPAPTNATGWLSSYVPGDVAPVRPLVYNSRDVLDTAIDAGQQFSRYLAGAGVRVRSVTRARVASGSTLVAATRSKALSTMVGTMLNVSQNDYAEMLLRVAALRRGRSASWSDSTANAVAVLADAGISTYGLRMFDGSGLSRSNRIPTPVLTSLLAKVATDQELSAVMLPQTALPVSGVSGTLRNRFKTAPTSCAATIIHAKTGSLRDVVALSGLAYGVDGRVRAFALLANGVSTPSATTSAVDALAATATGCM